MQRRRKSAPTYQTIPRQQTGQLSSGKHPKTPRRNSLRKSVNAKCKECIYDPYARGTWRKQVQESNARTHESGC